MNTARGLSPRAPLVETRVDLPTVKVVNEADSEGFMIINESDFDASVHQLFVEPGEAAQTAKKSRAKAQAEE